jgi:3-hydroxyisobutyrate dehydrogenase-like beta-hydroxyacid dehydrogenase
VDTISEIFMTRIHVIGLGAMGEPMAANLVKGGHPVTVVRHKRPEPVDRLVALGAEEAPDHAAAVRDADAVLLVLPSFREVEEVAGDVLVPNMRDGSLVIDCSTSEPASTKKLHAALKTKGIGLVDAPMTRGVAGAKNGTLAYFVGGTVEDIERARPILAAMGDTFFTMGGPGTGHATKVLSNALSYGTVALVNEIFTLGWRNGLDPQALQEALMAGAASKALESFGPRIIKREYLPARVPVANVVDHLAAAERMSSAAGVPEAFVRLTRALYEEVAARGYDSEDMASIVELAFPQSVRSGTEG